MIYFLLLFLMLGTSIVSGIGEALRIKDVKEYSSAWHWLQFFERTMFVAFGITVALLNDVFTIVVSVILFALIFWNIYDGIINVVARNEDFFDVSKTSEAITDKFSHWYIKLPLTLLFLVINFIAIIKKKESDK